MSALTEILEQIQEDLKLLKTRVDKIEPREIDSASKKNVLDQLDIVTDSGTAEPSAGVLNLLGDDATPSPAELPIKTTGVGNTTRVNWNAPYPPVVTTDRRFHCDFDGHSWPDLMEPGWEPTETGGVIYLGWEHMCGVLRKDSEYQYRATFDKAVQIAAAVTNLITNPSFETGVVSWAAQGAGAIARVADDYVFGDYCCEVTPTAAAWDGIVHNAIIAVAGATDYTVGVWIKSAASGVNMQIQVTTNVGGNIATRQFYSTTHWQYIVVTATTNVADAQITAIRIHKRNNASTDVFYVDAVQCEQSSYSSPFCDGSLGAGNQWTGAAHASTSTRAAATLTYPNDVVAYPNGDCYEQLTIVGWFIPAWDSTIASRKCAWSCRGAGVNDYIGLWYFTGTNRWDMRIKGNSLGGGGPAQVFSNWEPQFVTCTYDFDADEHRLYINDESPLVKTGLGVVPWAFTSPFYVGGSVAGGAEWDGLIDDFVIYPRVLSADEIQSIYKFGNPLLPPTHANMRIVPGEWTSTTFNGGGFSTVGWTTLDLVDDCSIPFGAKAIDVFVLSRDSGAAGQTFQLRKDATQSPSLHSWTNAGANMWINTCARIPVANGRTIDYQISASGALTQDVYMRIYCILL